MVPDKNGRRPAAMGARGGVGRRRSDGRKGVSLSELDLRRSQASSDALRRRQKAKAAAKTKRHYQYREKQRLLGELEASRKASATPIVAAELGTYAEDSGGDAASEDCLKHEVREGRNKRARSSATSTEHGADSDATDTAAKQTPHDEVPHTEADIKSVASLRPRSGSRGHQPFHKELKEAAERKAEKDAVFERFAREDAELAARRKEAKSARRLQAKNHRSRTRRGQPILRYKVDALLERIQRDTQSDRCSEGRKHE